VRRTGVLALLLVLLALPAAAFAADATRASFTDIEDEVMCVACGVPLTIADSPQADRERAYIRSLVAKDLTKDQIKTELVSTYGDRVLALPKGKGFGLAAYLVPIAIVLAMLAGLAVYLPRWRRNRGPEDSTIVTDGPALTDADSQRLAEDLARYDV
jgi:cytochrome c-type biogenesis protein CcmH/NrfF